MKNLTTNTQTTAGEITNRQIQFARLVEASRQAREMKEQLIQAKLSVASPNYYAVRPLNYFILMFVYKTEGVREFKTFNEWKQEGATIKKGSKAFPIWGQPIGLQKEEKAKEKGEIYEATEEENTRFPMCYVFSNLQVITKEEKEAAC